jgi:GDSL-like Lipase/Acylhydrolase family
MRAKTATTVLGLLIWLCLTVGTAGASSPAPPFGQCPAVGADTSCALLIHIEGNGQVGVLGDPTQGPFDGIEDTLIGVQNDSTASIASIPISATTEKDLFGFDGDGLCSFEVAGCPFGPTGYEGPGTSFTSISSDLTSGLVTFSPAVPPGGHAYFSLEEALATVPPFDLEPGEPTPAGIRYVALGDSYSSGEGNPPFLPGTAENGDDCHRSSVAYPELLATATSLNITSHESRACSGARRQDVLFGSRTEDSQLNHLASAQLVTLNVGGDDIGFADVLKECITGISPTIFKTHGNADCRNAPATNPDTGAKTNLDGREQALIADLGKNSATLCQTSGGYVACSPRLATLYYDIVSGSASNVHLFVLLYPHLFTTSPGRGGCTVGYGGNISYNNMQWINHGADLLDNEISSEINAARAAGLDVTAVDTRPLFDNGGSGSPGGHGVCTKDPWIYSIKLRGLNPGPYSFHPNPSGQEAFERATVEAIKNHP